MRSNAKRTIRIEQNWVINSAGGGGSLRITTNALAIRIIRDLARRRMPICWQTSTPQGLTKSTTRCDGCGYIGHCPDKKSCVYKDHPGYNAERVPFHIVRATNYPRTK